jgi:hypothetical protein
MAHCWHAEDEGDIPSASSAMREAGAVTPSSRSCQVEMNWFTILLNQPALHRHTLFFHKKLLTIEAHTWLLSLHRVCKSQRGMEEDSGSLAIKTES